MYLLYTSFPALRLSKPFYLILTALQGDWVKAYVAFVHCATPLALSKPFYLIFKINHNNSSKRGSGNSCIFCTLRCRD